MLFLSKCKTYLKHMTYVRPIYEYCSPVWSPHLKNKLIKLSLFNFFYQKATWFMG